MHFDIFCCSLLVNKFTYTPTVRIFMAMMVFLLRCSSTSISFFPSSSFFFPSSSFSISSFPPFPQIFSFLSSPCLFCFLSHARDSTIPRFIRASVGLSHLTFSAFMRVLASLHQPHATGVTIYPSLFSSQGYILLLLFLIRISLHKNFSLSNFSANTVPKSKSS